MHAYLTREKLRREHTESLDRGLRLTQTQEESGVIAALCFVAIAVGLIGLGLWAWVVG